MEEFFLHLWDEYDDLVGVCRHVGAAALGELFAATPRLATTAATAAALLALTGVLMHLPHIAA
ncbi:MAG: hypothetical protein JSR67_16865 [Proteobacteria bacterium]|nr:hypothetical protein [Pseudomonadota bacterium]